MNREIEFRGRNYSDGIWVYGDLEYERNKGLLSKVRIHTYKDDGSYDRQHLVESNTVGEFTGMRDKHGKKIFEGDILDVTVFDCFDNDEQYRVRVEWVGTEFMGVDVTNDDFEWNLCWLCNQDDEIEVIGNIFDNPRLIKTLSNEQTV